MTVYAGNIIYASDVNTPTDMLQRMREPLWELGSTSATAAIGASGVEATTADLTAPSSTYRALTVYRINVRGLIRASTTSGNLSIKIRDTNAAGTARFDNLPAIAITTSNQLLSFEHSIANTASTDITGRVLCMTFSHSAAGGALFNSASTLPWYFTCTEIGPTSAYPNTPTPL